MIYRVILRVSYIHESFFDFTEPLEACQFAQTALTHSTASEDQRKLSSITMKIINPEDEE